MFGRHPMCIRANCLLVAFLLFLLLACSDLPSDFDSLPLEKQVESYEEYLRHHVRQNEIARSRISWHGWAAADLMAEYLDHRRKGLPDLEAIEIIDAVQLRGCRLRGTSAEASLKRYVEHESRETIAGLAARMTLESIQKDITLGTNRYDELSGGPCDSLERGRVRPSDHQSR
jgi:hypothetical protein